MKNETRILPIEGLVKIHRDGTLILTATSCAIKMVVEYIECTAYGDRYKQFMEIRGAATVELNNVVHAISEDETLSAKGLLKLFANSDSVYGYLRLDYDLSQKSKSYNFLVDGAITKMLINK